MLCTPGWAELRLTATDPFERAGRSEMATSVVASASSFSPVDSALHATDPAGALSAIGINTPFSVSGSAAPRLDDSVDLLPGEPVLRQMLGGGSPISAATAHQGQFISPLTAGRPSLPSRRLNDWPYAVNGWQMSGLDDQGLAVAQSMVAMGNPVPAPGALALAILGFALVTRRRRVAA